MPKPHIPLDAASVANDHGNVRVKHETSINNLGPQCAEEKPESMRYMPFVLLVVLNTTSPAKR